MKMTWICKIRDSFVIILHYGWWCVCLKCDICIEQVCLMSVYKWDVNECWMNVFIKDEHQYITFYKYIKYTQYLFQENICDGSNTPAESRLLFMPQPTIFTSWSLFNIEFSQHHHHSEGKESHSLDCPSQDYLFHKSWVLAATPLCCCKLHFSKYSDHNATYGAGARASYRVQEKTMYYNNGAFLWISWMPAFLHRA